MRIPCEELKCSKCCRGIGHPAKEPVFGPEEASEAERLRDQGLTRIEERSERRLAVLDNGDCSNVQTDGLCRLYGEWRPTICKTYPLMLDGDDAVLSLGCRWVSEVLAPQICHGTLPVDLRAELTLAFDDLRSSVPTSIRQKWTRDLSKFPFVLRLNTEAL